MATTTTNTNNDKTIKKDDNSPPVTEATSVEKKKECIDFKVIYNKQKIDVNFSLDGTVAELKLHLESIISVPKAMQKVMIKGLAKDEETLRNLGVTNGAKIMIVGAKLNDILAMAAPSKQEIQNEIAASTSKEPLAKQQVHKKILDKGVPDDAMPGILSTNVIIYLYHTYFMNYLIIILFLSPIRILFQLFHSLEWSTNEEERSD